MKAPEEKIAVLRAHHALNPHPELVIDPQFAPGQTFFDPRDLVQVKCEMLRRVRVDGYSVTQAARAFGYSRYSYYATAHAWTKRG